MMKLSVTVLLLFCLLCTTALGAPLFNLTKLLKNSHFLRRRTLVDSQSNENSTVNRTKEELRKLFWKLNLSQIIIEPPPLPVPSNESGSSSGDIESGDGVECTKDEFTCNDGSCISSDKVCDKKSDCEDESDEDKGYCKKKRKEERKKKCKKDQFTCDNGNCIVYYHRCDGGDDCGDGSDEDPERCLEIECPRPGDIHCPSNGVCIDPSFICDGYEDCPDNWDEKTCPS